MTKLPLEDRQVQGLESPPYKLNQRCPIPGCEALGAERHHIWRRSFLIGDHWWVVVPDGAVVGNCVMLCPFHHDLITENKASITYDDGSYTYSGELLRWQPPFYASVEAFVAELEEIRDELIPDLKTPEKENGANSESLVCPTCGHIAKPKLEHVHEKPVLRKSWSVAVPVSEQENGAEVLDTLLEASRYEFARAGLAYGDEGTVKYHILATALALFVTHAQEVLDV